MEPGYKVRMLEMTCALSAVLTQSDKEQLFGLQKTAESALVNIADSMFNSHANTVIMPGEWGPSGGPAEAAATLLPDFETAG